MLELGGSDAFIVLDTDDLAGPCKAAAVARMENAGQACNAAKRFIVADDLYDEFVEQFTAAMAALTPGDPSDPATTTARCRRRPPPRLMAQVEDAVDKGATVRTGGTGPTGRARSSRPPCSPT